MVYFSLTASSLNSIPQTVRSCCCARSKTFRNALPWSPSTSRDISSDLGGTFVLPAKLRTSLLYTISTNWSSRELASYRVAHQLLGQLVLGRGCCVHSTVVTIVVLVIGIVSV